MLRFLLLTLLLISFSKASAQEVYFSISGQSSKIESGEKKGVYDLWIKPKTNTSTIIPKFEIYDAGMGGFADVVFREANTVTSYKVYPFSALYTVNDSTILANGGQTEALQTVEVRNEQKFKNRWVDLLQISQASVSGWILRVETDNGDDVNNFNLRLLGEADDQFDIVSLDLSIGLYKTTPSTSIQLKPLFDNLAPPQLVVTGEEDIIVSKFDAFGSRIDLADTTWETQKYELSNSWALVLKGSQQRLNNLVISGKKQIVPWIIRPIIKEKENLTDAKFVTKPQGNCEELSLELQSQGYDVDINNSIWIIENERYVGKRIQHRFERKGTVPVTILSPIKGRYTPLYHSTTSSVFINQSPKIRIRDHKKVISPSEPLVIDASGSIDPEGKPLEYAWLVNNVFRSSDSRLEFTSSTSGEYKIQLIVDDKAANSACTTSETSFIIRVNTQPYAEIELTKIVAEGSTSRMFANSILDSDGDQIAFLWKVDGLISDSSRDEIEVAHDKRGLYTAQLEVNDQSKTTNAVYKTSRTYKVNGAPVPKFTIPDLIAPFESFRLNALQSSDPDNDKLTYSWLISDARTSDNATWDIHFPEPGEYQITLTVNDGELVSNSSQKISKSIRVNEAPIAIIRSVDKSNFSDVEFKANESMDADQSIVSYLWNFGDGTTGSGSEIIHQFNKPGIYTVKLTIDDGMKMANSVQSTTKKVLINKNPVADFTLPSLVAPGDKFELNASLSKDDDGEIVSYEWFINQTPIGNGKSFTTSLIEPGDHIISLRVKDNSGFEDAVHSTSKLIHVNFAPVIVWENIPLVTEVEKPTLFTAKKSFDKDNSTLQYTWELEGAAPQKGAEVRYSFKKQGTYTIKITVDDGRHLSNSVQEAEGTIRVNAAPILVTEKRIVTNSQSVRLDATKSYDPDGSSLAFTWILPDGTKRNEPLFTWNSTESGFFKIGLVIDDQDNLSNSKVSTGIDVIINRPVVAVVDSVIEACTGQIIIFSSARSYDPDGDQFSTEWSFGDGKSSLDNNPYHTYTEPGIYTATLKLSDGISAEPTFAQIAVKVAGSPTARMTFLDTTVCINTPILFDASPSTDPNGPIGAYSWDFGDESTGLGKSVTHLFSRPGTYNVVLTIVGTDAGNCSNVSQIAANVTVVEGPEAIFEVPEWVNKNEEVVLDGSSSRVTGNIKKAEWRIYGVNQPELLLVGLKQSFIPKESGLVKISLYLEVESGSNCNFSVLEKVLKINYSPIISWNLKSIYEGNTAFSVNAKGTNDQDGLISSFMWLLNGKKIGSGIEAQIGALKNGSYTLELIVKDNSGIKSGTVSQQSTFLVNASPKADFVIKQPTYKGETISLVPSTLVDKDNQTLKSTWLVNGKVYNSSQIRLTEPSYKITLIQDDSQGLSNSVDSVSHIIKVEQAPTLDTYLPNSILLGSSISIAELNVPKSIYFAKDDVISNVWKAEFLGKQDIYLVWAPRDSILNRELFTISVLPALQTEDAVKPVIIKWNPANPFAQVTAPEMNRDSDSILIYEWFSAGKSIGFGKSLSVQVRKGTQEVSLQVNEQGVKGNKTFTTKLTIIAN